MPSYKINLVRMTSFFVTPIIIGYNHRMFQNPMELQYVYILYILNRKCPSISFFLRDKRDRR